MLALLGSATAYRPAMAPSTSTAAHRALAPTMQLHSRRTAIQVGTTSLLAPAVALFQAPGGAVAADPIWSITEPDFASATTTLLAAKTLAEYLDEVEAEGAAPPTDAARRQAELNVERAKAREDQLKLAEERRAAMKARAEAAEEERQKALEESKARSAKLAAEAAERRAESEARAKAYNEKLKEEAAARAAKVAEAKAAAKAAAEAAASKGNRLQDVPVDNGEVGDGDPLPKTAEGPVVCTDMDLNMGIPTRSAFAGLCCTWCTGDEGDVDSSGKICCPTRAMKTGEPEP